MGRSTVIAMCGVQLKDKKRVYGLIFLLGLNKTIDQSAMVNSIAVYCHLLRKKDGHVLRRDDGHVLRKEDRCLVKSRLKVKGRKGRQKRHGTSRLRQKA